MGSYYVRFAPHGKPRSFSAYEPDVTDWPVLLFDPGLERSMVSVGDRFGQIEPQVRDTSLVVLRLAHESDIELLNDRTLHALLRGTPCLALLGSGDSPNCEPSLRQVEGLAAPPVFPAISQLRELELHGLAHFTGAYRSSSLYHFQLQSGYHAEAYVDLRRMLHHMQNVSRVADWVMPMARGASLIVSDTGWLLPLQMELNARSVREHNGEIRLDALPSYPANLVEFRDYLETARSPVGPRQRCLFLQSVSASGRLSHFFDLVRDEHWQELVICDVEQDAKHKTTSLFRLPIDSWNPAVEPGCTRCRDLATQCLHIDRASFEVIPPLSEPEPLRLNVAIADRIKNFWTIVDRTDAVRFHVERPYRDDTTGIPRHFAVELEPSKLIKNEAFVEHCGSALTRNGIADVIFIPQHRFTEDLFRFARSFLHTSRIVVITTEMSDVEICSHVHGDQTVLVLDDSIITGQTLRGIRDRLFFACQSQRDNWDIRAFALVCRPADHRVVRALQRTYANSKGFSNVDWGFEVLLPSGDECSWCGEAELLRKSMDDLDPEHRSVIRYRLRLLEAPNTADDLVWGGSRRPQGVSTEGSFFGRLGRSAAMGAAMCAAQTVSSEVSRLADQGKQTRVDAQHLVEAFYETPFVACMFRVFRPSELRSLISSDSRYNPLNLINAHEAYPGLCEELAVSAAMGKINAALAAALLKRALESSSTPGFTRDALCLLNLLETVAPIGP